MEILPELTLQPMEMMPAMRYGYALLVTLIFKTGQPMLSMEARASTAHGSTYRTGEYKCDGSIESKSVNRCWKEIFESIRRKMHMLHEGKEPELLKY